MSGGLSVAVNWPLRLIAFVASHWQSAQLRLTDQRKDK